MTYDNEVVVRHAYHTTEGDSSIPLVALPAIHV